jgi:S-adenosylmethionine hydrolase
VTSNRSIVALLTDFGIRDSYVSEMKGVMLSINAELQFVDIAHTIAPGDIRHAAYLLWRSHSWFPRGTIFLSVVDPGVGGNRDILLLKTSNHSYIAPDNGLLTLIAGECEHEVWALTQNAAAHGSASCTFHGRDIMAPACARLSLGSVKPSDLGEPSDGIVTFEIKKPVASESSVDGVVISIDRYGNAITNIPAARLTELGELAGLRVLFGGRIVSSVKETFSSVREGEVVAYIGSADLLELAVNRGNFAAEYAAEPGAGVRVENG